MSETAEENPGTGNKRKTKIGKAEKIFKKIRPVDLKNKLHTRCYVIPMKKNRRKSGKKG